MKETAFVLIDGGYFSKIIKTLNMQIDLEGLSNELCKPYKRIRTYYYDCLPWMPSKNPSEKDKERFSKKQRFFNTISSLQRFEIRQGRLERRVSLNEDGSKTVKFDQKLVDVLLSVDLVRLAWSKQAECIIIITGDSDFVPAIRTAKEAGIIIRVAYSKIKGVTAHSELLKTCDEKVLMNREFLEQFSLSQ